MSPVLAPEPCPAGLAEFVSIEPANWAAVARCRQILGQALRRGIKGRLEPGTRRQEKKGEAPWWSLF